MDSENQEDRMSHVSPRHPRPTKEETSRQVANEFCNAYTKQFGVPASVIDVETENVDAIIRVGEDRIALELVSYRQRDEYHELERADSQVREQISRAQAASGLPAFQVKISWAMEDRRKRDVALSPKRPKIPRGQQAMNFAREIVALVACAQKDCTLHNNHIGFCNDPQARNRGAPPGWVFMRRAQFPLLSEYCFFVRIEPWPLATNPPIRTSADMRVTGLDEFQLRDGIRKKLRKFAQYRAGVGDKQLWLLVHSDGHPLSARLPPGLHERAVKVIREEIPEEGASFDKVWWGENTGFSDAAELYPAK